MLYTKLVLNVYGDGQ